MAKLKPILKALAVASKKHAPEILTGLGCGGYLTSIFLTAKAAPKAQKHIEEAQAETFKEKVQATYKDYAAPAFTAAASTGLVVAGAVTGHRRYAAAAATAMLGETAFSEYRDSVKELIGEEKEAEIREKTAEKVKERGSNSGTNTTMVLGNNKIPCLDTTTGLYFQSSAIELRKIENELNRELNDSCYVSLNDFYDAIDQPHTTVGDEVGWSSNDRIELDLTPGLTPDEVPCIVVDFLKRPTTGYREFF